VGSQAGTAKEGVIVIRVWTEADTPRIPRARIISPAGDRANPSGC
jgi:hypothetical protein